jgi:hypothetical protein
LDLNHLLQNNNVTNNRLCTIQYTVILGPNNLKIWMYGLLKAVSMECKSQFYTTFVSLKVELA